jgi:hypothetical protein
VKSPPADHFARRDWPPDHLCTDPPRVEGPASARTSLPAVLGVFPCIYSPAFGWHGGEHRAGHLTAVHHPCCGHLVHCCRVWVGWPHVAGLCDCGQDPLRVGWVSVEDQDASAIVAGSGICPYEWGHHADSTADVPVAGALAVAVSFQHIEQAGDELPGRRWLRGGSVPHSRTSDPVSPRPVLDSLRRGRLRCAAILTQVDYG